MSHIPSVPPSVNAFVKFILRSPMHGLISRNILLITFTGRKSGKMYTIPVGYSQNDGRVTIFTHHSWWKNLPGSSPVTLTLRGREARGLAEAVVEDKQAIAVGLTAHLQKVPGDAKYYEVSFDNRKNPRAQDVERAAQNVVMINVRLC